MKVGAKPGKILVVSNRALGDSVLGLVAPRYLKTVYPKAYITYAISAWTCELYRNVEIDSDEIFPLNLKSLKGCLDLIVHLYKKRYDVVIELGQGGTTGKFFSFFKYILRFRYIYYNHHRPYRGYQKEHKSFIFDQGVQKAITARHLDTCYSYVRTQIPDCIYPHHLDFAPRMRLKIAPLINHQMNHKTIILGVVASREEKKWPINYFVDLIHKISQKYGDVRFIVPLSNSSDDQQTKKKLSLFASEINLLFLEKPLSELPTELGTASIYIGNDTGLKHICIALGLKTITFFGPEGPLEWHPYEVDKHFYFWPLGDALGVCLEDSRGDASGEAICLIKESYDSYPLTLITPDRVLKILDEKEFIKLT